MSLRKEAELAAEIEQKLVPQADKALRAEFEAHKADGLVYENTYEEWKHAQMPHWRENPGEFHGVLRKRGMDVEAIQRTLGEARQRVQHARNEVDAGFAARGIGPRPSTKDAQEIQALMHEMALDTDDPAQAGADAVVNYYGQPKRDGESDAHAQQRADYLMDLAAQGKVSEGELNDMLDGRFVTRDLRRGGGTSHTREELDQMRREGDEADKALMGQPPQPPAQQADTQE